MALDPVAGGGAAVCVRGDSLADGGVSGAASAGRPEADVSADGVPGDETPGGGTERGFARGTVPLATMVGAGDS